METGREYPKFRDAEIETRIIETVQEADIDTLAMIHNEITNYPPIDPEQIVCDIDEVAENEREVMYCEICGWESFDPNQYEEPCGQSGCKGTLNRRRIEQFDI